ncbi:MAG: ATP-binding protein [Anaerolineales bacterium]|nr:ATP-binding protein [Anaerolineales bacterium]
MSNSRPDEAILREFPLPLAKICEAVGLETDAQLKTRKLVDLFEETVRYLSLVGLALYDHFGYSDLRVREARKALDRPSLGHWFALMDALDVCLRENGGDLYTPSHSEIYRDGPIFEAYTIMIDMMDLQGAKKLKLKPFLSSIVEFRNAKFGHGALTVLEAKQVVRPLQAAIETWLLGLPIIKAYQLLYIHDVRVQDSDFVYDGTNLNSGTSMYASGLPGMDKLTPRQVYIHRENQFISLYPYLWFENDTKLLYLYTGLSKKSNPTLKCPYDLSGAQSSIELDVDSDKIISGKKKVTRPSQPKSESKSTVKETPEVKEYSPMKTWYEIIPPHEDIRNGDFDESIFAADLGDVVSGDAKQDYKDPYLFYKKTYLTQGLKSLLQRVHTTITTDKGSSVVQIQTPFGGGKTHALVAIYHYIKNGKEVKELLPTGLDLIDPNVAVIAGNHWNPVEGNTTDGITRLTFWGEIGYQIAGVEGYEFFRQNDEARVSPGKKKIREFLEAHQPFVLLFDEILEYINRARDVRKQVEESLGTQTFSFFQELTEAVSTLPNGMLVVTLPSSIIEDFGDVEEEALAKLGKIFGRVESIETPVQGEEIYAVIRRRLFEVENLKKTEMREVVHSYFQTYKQYRDDLPVKARDVNYRDRMEMAYPFHPDLIDIMNEKWGTYSTFQRTRGVLRLLANIVEDLYKREKPIDLILPGDINMGFPGIREEFLKHIGKEYESVLSSDVSGHDAKSQALDVANKSWHHLAESISTSIFYHSFAADDSEKGINLSFIRLAVLRSDTIPALVTDILQRLSNSLWYLNSRGDAYYFSKIPNLNRMILDKKELFSESFEEEMQERIKKELGSKFRTYLWPTTSEEVPDNQELKLVLLPPNDSGEEISSWIEYKGKNYRHNKNTLFFAIADTAQFASLREEVKTYLALREIEEEIKSGESSNLETKSGEVQKRKHKIEKDFSYNIRRMYHMVQVGDRKIDLGNPTTGAEALGNWYWRELTSDAYGVIVPQLHYKVLVNKFMENVDQLSTVALLDQFYKEPSLPSLAEQEVITRAIQLGVKEGAFGLVETKDGQIVLKSLKFREDIPLALIAFMEDYLLISEAKSEKLLVEKEKLEKGTGFGGDFGSDDGDDELPPEIQPEPPSIPETPGEKRYKRVKLRVENIPASKIADVNRGVLLPISSVQGDFEFTLEIDVSNDEGITQSTIDNRIKETIKQIGAQIVDEELEE